MTILTDAGPAPHLLAPPSASPPPAIGPGGAMALGAGLFLKLGWLFGARGREPREVTVVVATRGRWLASAESRDPAYSPRMHGMLVVATRLL